MTDLLASFENSRWLILGAVFLAVSALVLFAALLIVPTIETRRRLTQTLLAEGSSGRRSLEGQSQIRKAAAQRSVEAYFRAAEKERGTPNALEAKLFRAGFHQPYASLVYQLSRVVCVALVFLAAYSLFSTVLPPRMPRIIPLAGSFILGLGCIVVPSIALDRFEAAVKEKYRRGFPDFMDMMITCADAGMSLEAAVERVSAELGGTHKALGIQLAIMTLQMRAGKPLRDALHELSDRIAIDEARSLAILFRQSEELGTSLTEALRVYSDEMRSGRILRAEERANALPVKMMIPLGLCIFPVVLMIVLLPVYIRLKGIVF